MRQPLVALVLVLVVSVGVACSWPSLVVVTYIANDNDCSAYTLPSQIEVAGTIWKGSAVESCPGAMSYTSTGVPRPPAVYAKVHRYRDQYDGFSVDRCELGLALQTVCLSAGPIDRRRQGDVVEHLASFARVSAALGQAASITFLPTFVGRIVTGADVAALKDMCR